MSSNMSVGSKTNINISTGPKIFNSVADWADLVVKESHLKDYRDRFDLWSLADLASQTAPQTARLTVGQQVRLAFVRDAVQNMSVDELRAAVSNSQGTLAKQVEEFAFKKIEERYAGSSDYQGDFTVYLQQCDAFIDEIKTYPNFAERLATVLASVYLHRHHAHESDKATEVVRRIILNIAPTPYTLVPKPVGTVTGAAPVLNPTTGPATPVYRWANAYSGAVNPVDYPALTLTAPQAIAGKDAWIQVGNEQAVTMQTLTGDKLDDGRALDNWGPVKDDEIWGAWANREQYIQWVLQENDIKKPFNYWDRVVQQSADWPLWMKALETHSSPLPKLSTEAKHWVELTSVLLDAGNDGLGSSAHQQFIRDDDKTYLGATAAPVSALLYAVMVCKGTTPYAIEKVFADPSLTAKIAHVFTDSFETDKAPNLKQHLTDFTARLSKDAVLQKEFAAAILLLKLCDMSRGDAWKAVKDSSKDGASLLSKLKTSRHFSLAQVALSPASATASPKPEESDASDPGLW